MAAPRRLQTQKFEGHALPAWLITACGAWQVGLGLYFIFVRPALLPEDTRYIGADFAALQAVAPQIAPWLDKVFTVMGGFMAGVGVLVVFVARQVMPLQPRGAASALAATGALTLGLMSVMNFALHSNFRWLLVAPPVAWALAVVLYMLNRR
jgi:hypothetical protein